MYTAPNRYVYAAPIAAKAICRNSCTQNYAVKTACSCVQQNCTATCTRSEPSTIDCNKNFMQRRLILCLNTLSLTLPRLQASEKLGSPIGLLKIRGVGKTQGFRMCTKDATRPGQRPTSILSSHHWTCHRDTDGSAETRGAQREAACGLRRPKSPASTSGACEGSSGWCAHMSYRGVCL